MMYDKFSGDYDRFVNWTDRLAFEMPFLEKQIQLIQKDTGQSLAILDSACGTGMHAIALAKAGQKVFGADLFSEMIEKSKVNAQQSGLPVTFKTAGFGELTSAFGEEQFHLVLCLGNSLPHILTEKDLAAALADFVATLRTGGMLFIQNRNFDAVVQRKERWMEPQAFQADGEEWIFQRFYDYLEDGTIRFNIVTLKKALDTDWQVEVGSTLLRPQLYGELSRLLEDVGFRDIKAYGSMQGESFSAAKSGNLIITAIKA
jgi:2-polyprenyl-3-methyl-5-hydroxy-6-metoxy-1,4-benzoquinol methylase